MPRGAVRKMLKLWPIFIKPPRGYKTLVIGPEFDDAFLKILREVLKGMGARETNTWMGGGGTQDIVLNEFRIQGAKVRIVQETYMGLAVTAKDAVADDIEMRVRSRLGKKRPLRYPETQRRKLGEAGDTRLRDATRRVLILRGAKTYPRRGNQASELVVEDWDFEIDGQELQYEEATTNGISITGEAYLVDELAKEIRAETLKAEPAGDSLPPT
jgi:hypothetical protein